MKSSLKFFFRFFTFILFQFGIDYTKPINFIKSIPKYILNLFAFKKKYSGKFELLPCLHDWYEEGGNAKSEYFLQDLHIARLIFKRNPLNHLDIGSSVEGFVAHVASFRMIDVLDVRPINSNIPGIVFKQMDLSKPIEVSYYETYDSISCLHALEHFGLGRYGDPIDVDGHVKGIENMSKLLSREGVLYLSVPIGIERVEFNANRVFNPQNLINIANNFGLVLSKFALIENSVVTFFENQKDIEFDRLSSQRYALGMFIFVKS